MDPINITFGPIVAASFQQSRSNPCSHISSVRLVQTSYVTN